MTANAISEEEELAALPTRRQRFRIEPNIRLGEVLILLTIIGGGVSAWFGLTARVDQNGRELQSFISQQSQRDGQQDAVVTRIETHLKDGIQTIRNDQIELRREVGEIGRYVRNRGG